MSGEQFSTETDLAFSSLIPPAPAFELGRTEALSTYFGTSEGRGSSELEEPAIPRASPHFQVLIFPFNLNLSYLVKGAWALGIRGTVTEVTRAFCASQSIYFHVMMEALPMSQETAKVPGAHSLPEVALGGPCTSTLSKNGTQEQL